jgi:hypothetical protein
MRKLPKIFEVDGELTLSGRLSSELVAGGEHQCKGLFCTLQEGVHIPDGMVIDGPMNLTGSQVSYFGEQVRVGGPLDCMDCSLDHLPGDLWVRGSINVAGTHLRALPPDLRMQAGAHLWISRSPLSRLSDEDLFAMAPGIRGVEVMR